MAFAEAFEALFLIADADRDGYISGGEAINFFRSADLPQPTLAKIWEFANKDQTGFLSRKEFFDALKLATVAQMGRELTPELVKAALTGPAAAQIPPPRMTLRPPSVSLEETGAPPQNSQPTPMQANYGQHFSSPQSGTAPDHFGLQGSARRVPSNASLSTANASLNASDSASNEPRAVNPPNFQGGTQLTRLVDAGPLKTSASREPHGLGEFSRPNSSIGDMATNCSPRPLSAGPTGSLGLTQAPPSVNVTSNPGTWGYDGRQLGAAASPHWPKITPSDMQRFVQVFSQMDTDHDGKITGEQARQLFLSWQLPREVLRHVWNLSDEDGDSMLSVREFCTAVYLLEKFTEGWPLPSRLPTGIHLDETPTSAKNVFAPESVLGSGGSNWRPPQGSVPPTDFVLEPGPEFDALSTSSARHVQNPLSTGDVSLERANCVPQNSQTSHTKSHFIKQNREPERTLTPTPAEPIKIVPTQVAGLNRHGMSQKEKAEYYRSKLQEIVLFKSQCDSKQADLREKIVVFMHEVNTLNLQYNEKVNSASDVETEIAAEVSTLKHIQERKRELSRALLRLDDENRASESHLQTQLDHIAVDLHKLRKMLLVKAESLGVEIKQADLTKKIPFGWQPNIQKKAAEWKKGWDTSDDEGFTEVPELHICPPSEVPPMAISTGEVSAAAGDNVEGEDALVLDIDDQCGLHRPSAQAQSSVLESFAASSGSVAITGVSTEIPMRMPVHIDKPRSTNETMTGNAVHNNSSTASGTSTVAAETLTRDAPDIHPGIARETATETSTTPEVKTFVINTPSSRSYPGADSSSEVGSSITLDTVGGNETDKRIGQNDDSAGSSLRTALELQSYSRSFQSSAETKASDRELRSRGSFEPEDYFDLSSPRDLSMPLPPSGCAATALEHTTSNRSPAGHDDFKTYGFLAYNIKESSGSSPIFTNSPNQPFNTLVHTTSNHGPDEYPREGLPVFDESGSDAASPNVSGKW